MHRIGQGDLSCKKARDVGVDAIRSGACGNRLKNFIGTGTNGEHEQNLEREMYAQCLKQLNLPDILYDVQVFIRKMNGCGICRVKWPVLLPHEIFGLMYEKRQAQFHETFQTDENTLYWVETLKNEPMWLRAHPMRSLIISQMDLVSPFRIFGDDTGISKNCERPVSCLTWDADVSHGDVWKTKIPVYIIPAHVCVEGGLTLDDLDEAAAWSFNCLSIGEWPVLDHKGRPFKPKSWRGKRAGTPLTADFRSGAFAASVSDWDWLEKTYKFGTNWHTDEICWCCPATKDGGALDFTKFQPLAPRSHEEYMTRVGNTRPICGIIGWHLNSVVPEAMHCGPLGTLQCLNGTLLKQLADQGIWGDGGISSGNWFDKLDCQLSPA